VGSLVLKGFLGGKNRRGDDTNGGKKFSGETNGERKVGGTFKKVFGVCKRKNEHSFHLNPVQKGGMTQLTSVQKREKWEHDRVPSRGILRRQTIIVAPKKKKPLQGKSKAPGRHSKQRH